MDANGAIALDTRKLRTKAEMEEKLRSLGLPLKQTVAKAKNSLEKHKKSVGKQYAEKGFDTATVNFWNNHILI